MGELADEAVDVAGAGLVGHVVLLARRQVVPEGVRGDTAADRVRGAAEPAQRGRQRRTVGPLLSTPARLVAA